MGVQGVYERIGLFRRAIDYDQSINPRIGGITGKGLEPGR